MASVNMNWIVDLLNQHDIRASFAFPARQIYKVSSVAAMVSIQERDAKTKSTTFKVDVFGAKVEGGYACQNWAQSVYRILSDEGAVCRQGSCEFLSQAEVFRVPVEAVFYDCENFLITAGGMTLNYACGFSSDQVRSSSTENMMFGPWEFTVEEFFPWGVLNSLEPDEPFLLEVRSGGRIERYEGCRWTRWQRISEKTGVRQIRTGDAASRTITSG